VDKSLEEFHAEAAEFERIATPGKASNSGKNRHSNSNELAGTTFEQEIGLFFFEGNCREQRLFSANY
jgi:hypothetical protein